MRSGLWRELKENAVESYRRESEGNTPMFGRLDSLNEDMLPFLSFLLVLISSLSTMLFGNSLGGSTSDDLSFLLIYTGSIEGG